MAYYSVLAYLALFSLTANLCHSSNINRKLLNNNGQYGGGGGSSSGGNSSSSSSTSIATWYGDAYGAGSTGGSCGYQGSVATPPFNSLITAVSPTLYHNGHGCGTCYQVKCTSEHCSGNTVTVVVTDSCPGCESTGIHYFDLSGTAFGAMATSGQDKQLRDRGTVEIEYKSVPCNFPGTKVTFKIDTGSNPNYLAFEIEYEDGYELSKVEIKASDSTAQWKEMQESWGAIYKIDSPGVGPFSIRLTEKSTYAPIVAVNVIPANFQPGATYVSIVNFA